MRRLLALLLCCCALTLPAQPSLSALWDRHDVLVLAKERKTLKADPAWIHLFTGRRGQQVRGWDTGPATGPTVLIWTGGPGGWVEPDSLPEAVGDPAAFRWIALDQPGVGDGTSAWIPGWRPEDTVDDAAAFLRLRKVQGPVLVCGWSWGSTMALLFAQRHPELTRGVVVGGVWANSPAEVRYYLGASGTRALMPGLPEAFAAVAPGDATACDLHRAIREGRGGAALAQAYSRAEGLQAVADTSMREPGLPEQNDQPGTPIDMRSCTDPILRFAYIESEMMCRGQRGQWRLRLRFPKALAKVPLVILQGRYDQVCDPQVAVQVFRAWPGSSKRLVPLNIGHGGHRGLTKEELTRARLDPELQPALRRATGLHYGDPNALVAAALELLP